MEFILLTLQQVKLLGLDCAVVYMHSLRIRSSSNSSLAGRQTDRQTVFVTPNHTTHIADLDQWFHRHDMSCVFAYCASSQIDFFVFLLPF